MNCYLFVHFKEKTTPDGEQIYFGLSRDGLKWEEVNGGRPVLWAYYGDKGVRDHTIVRNKNTGKFHIFSTDLGLAYGMRNQYTESWKTITREGSKNLSTWESEDLVNWSEQKLVKIGTDDMGCLWAPDILDSGGGEYILHWSSSHKSDDYRHKKIFYRKTMDFIEFSEPEILYQQDDCSIIDSAMYEEDGKYYLFVKSDSPPAGIILLKSDSPIGPFEIADNFDRSLFTGTYEAATAVRVQEGNWHLFIDFYGARGAKQGYIPFVASSLEKADFRRAEDLFSFPYRFKHGTILTITEEEYNRIKAFDFNIDDYSKY